MQELVGTAPAAIGCAQPQRSTCAVKPRDKRARGWIASGHRRLVAYAFRKSLRLAGNGEHEKAFALLRRLGTAMPNAPRVQLWLADECGRVDKDPEIARRAIRAAARADRATAGVLARAAICQLDRGELGAALQILASAKERFPSSWCVWRALGKLYLEKGDAKESLDCFRRQVELAPSRKVRLNAMSMLANCFAELGEKNEALSTCEKIIAEEPRAAAAYWHLVTAQESADEDLIAKMRNVLRSRGVGEEDRGFVHYALGQACDRAGHYAEAFAHFHLANEIRAKTAAPMTIKRLRDEIDKCTKLFTRDLLARLNEHGCREHRPICIVGMPRSGTTLVEQIVSAHSSVCALGERGDINRLTRAMRWHLRSKKPYPECVDALSPAAVRQLARPIADRRNEEARGCPRVTTKLPRDYCGLGLISILFPRAKFIHCYRDPIDTCLSCYMQNFKYMAFATSLARLAEEYRFIRDLRP